MTRPSGVPKYMVPSTTSGVASNAVGVRVAKRRSVSPVRYVHATPSRLTFSRMISVAGQPRPLDIASVSHPGHVFGVHHQDAHPECHGCREYSHG